MHYKDTLKLIKNFITNLPERYNYYKYEIDYYSFKSLNFFNIFNKCHIYKKNNKVIFLDSYKNFYNIENKLKKILEESNYHRFIFYFYVTCYFITKTNNFSFYEFNENINLHYLRYTIEEKVLIENIINKINYYPAGFLLTKNAEKNFLNLQNMKKKITINKLSFKKYNQENYLELLNYLDKIFIN